MCLYHKLLRLLLWRLSHERWGININIINKYNLSVTVCGEYHIFGHVLVELEYQCSKTEKDKHSNALISYFPCEGSFPCICNKALQIPGLNETLSILTRYILLTESLMRPLSKERFISLKPFISLIWQKKFLTDILPQESKLAYRIITCSLFTVWL